MTDRPPAPPVEPVNAEPAHVSEDLLCLKCGYNLRGLDFRGSCPECGTSIGKSTYGNTLRFGDPAWVRRLASGMRWITWGNIYVLLSAFLAHVALLGGMNFRSAGLGMILPGLVWLVGCWKLTTPDPAESFPESIDARSLARWTTVVSLLVIPLGALAERLFPQYSSLIWAAWWSMALVSTLAVMHYVGRLTRRIPRDLLRQQGQIIIWGIGILGVVEFSAYAVHLAKTGTLMAGVAASQPSTSDVLEILTGGFVCSAALDLLVLRLWWAVLVLRLRRAFRLAAEAATAFWDTESVPICARPLAADEWRLPPSDRASFDRAGRVAGDIACVRCGLNLRGLDPYAACPGCAAPVGLTTHGDLLRFAGPAWLKQLASGVNWYLAGLLFCALGDLLASQLVEGLWGKVSDALLLLVLGLVSLIGLWKLTAPEADAPVLPKLSNARMFARQTAIASWILASVWALFKESPAPYCQVVEIVSETAAAAAGCALLAYLGRLSRRIPDQNLTMRTRVLMWVVPLVQLALAVWSLTLPRAAGAAGPLTSQPEESASQTMVHYGPPCVILLIAMLLAVWCVVVLLRFRLEFRKAGHLATETWAKPPAAIPTAKPLGL